MPALLEHSNLIMICSILTLIACLQSYGSNFINRSDKDLCAEYEDLFPGTRAIITAALA